MQLSVTQSQGSPTRPPISFAAAFGSRAALIAAVDETTLAPETSEQRDRRPRPVVVGDLAGDQPAVDRIHGVDQRLSAGQPQPLEQNDRVAGLERKAGRLRIGRSRVREAQHAVRDGVAETFEHLGDALELGDGPLGVQRGEGGDEAPAPVEHVDQPVALQQAERLAQR